MRRVVGIVLGLCALPAGVAVGVTFAEGVNLHYFFHPVYFIGTAIALALALPLSRASLLAFGVGRRRALVVPIAVTLAWAAAFFVFSVIRFPDRNDAVRKNGAVLRAMPEYPGLHLVLQSTESHYDGDMVNEGFISPPYFETIWTWSARGSSSLHAVVNWYAERLRREHWSVQRGTESEGWIVLSAARGGTNLEVELGPTRASVDKRTPILAEVDATTGF
jgi:hypothetical protein